MDSMMFSIDLVFLRTNIGLLQSVRNQTMLWRQLGFEPTGLENSGLETSGLETSGFEPTGLENSGLENSGLENSGLEPEISRMRFYRRFL